MGKGWEILQVILPRHVDALLHVAKAGPTWARGELLPLTLFDYNLVRYD